MSTLTLQGNPPIDVRLIRSSRAKRMSLRVSQLDGAVRLTLPTRCALREAEDFLADRADWVRNHVQGAVQTSTVGIGSSIPFQGQSLPIVSGPGRGVRIGDGHIIVGGQQGTAAKRVQAFLKEQARAALAPATDHYAAQLRVNVGRLSFKDTKSRWGSCSAAGNINYSWRLIMAPPDILQYVAAHEVAHRLEMNHSNRYWAHVARIFPDYQACRRWLRSHGTQLHSYRFDTP